MRGEPQQCPHVLLGGPRPGAPRSRQGSRLPLACPQHHVGRPGRELGAGGGQVSGGGGGGASPAGSGGRAAGAALPAAPHATGARGRSCPRARCAAAGVRVRPAHPREAASPRRDSSEGHLPCGKSVSPRLLLSRFFLTAAGNGQRRGGKKAPSIPTSSSVIFLYFSAVALKIFQPIIAWCCKCLLMEVKQPLDCDAVWIMELCESASWQTDIFRRIKAFIPRRLCLTLRMGRDEAACSK